MGFIPPPLFLLGCLPPFSALLLRLICWRMWIQTDLPCCRGCCETRCQHRAKQKKRNEHNYKCILCTSHLEDMPAFADIHNCLPLRVNTGKCQTIYKRLQTFRCLQDFISMNTHSQIFSSMSEELTGSWARGSLFVICLLALRDPISFVVQFHYFPVLGECL